MPEKSGINRFSASHDIDLFSPIETRRQFTIAALWLTSQLAKGLNSDKQKVIVPSARHHHFIVPAQYIKPMDFQGLIMWCTNVQVENHWVYNLLVHTPPVSGDRNPMAMRNSGTHRPSLCFRSWQNAMSAPTRWTKIDEMRAHTNTWYQISVNIDKD